MAAVLIDDERVEIPEGFCVVTRGVVRAADRGYDPETGDWCEVDDGDYYGLGESVKDFYCVIRLDPAATEGQK